MQVLANEVPDITKAHLVEFGIYLTSVEATAPAAGTTTIPAIAKSSFGIRYQIEGIPAGSVIEVRDVVITPGLKDPDSHETPSVNLNRKVAHH